VGNAVGVIEGEVGGCRGEERKKVGKKPFKNS
jgi:hypothetical protein